jgi:hypothetical protein
MDVRARETDNLMNGKRAIGRDVAKTGINNAGGCKADDLLGQG